MNRESRARVVALYVGLTVAALIVARCTTRTVDTAASEPPATVAVTTSLPAPPLPSVVTTAATPVQPATSTVEARPVPATPPLAARDIEVRDVTVRFLQGWVLRASIDDRLAALTPVTANGYGDAVAWTDPDLANLPPGTSVVIDAVTVNDLGATVGAHVDGLPVAVTLTRTADGDRVVNHSTA